MKFDIKRVIATAQLATQEKFGLRDTFENISAYRDAEAPARAISLWMQANKAALDYSGPDRATLERAEATASAGVSKAREQLRAAERVLMQTYPSAFAPGAAADVNMEIDMSLVGARDTASNRVSVCQDDAREAAAALRVLKEHEVAVCGFSRILAQLLGMEAR